MRALRRLLPTLLLVVVCGPAAWAADPNGAELTIRIKAAYLSKFLPYIEWPDSAGESATTRVIGVIGADKLAEELRQLSEADRAGAPQFAVRRLVAGDDLSGIHIVYIGLDDPARVKALTGNPRNRSLLTVTDTDAGLAIGGMINFVIVQQRIRFEISRDNLSSSGIRINSRLLDLAYRAPGGAS